MADSWTWNVAELPYRYGVEIRGDKVVWIWDSGPGIPPTEEAQPIGPLLTQGRAAVPSAWQQIPPPILDQLLQRLQASSAGAGATGPTQFAPAVTAAVASNPQGSGAAPAGWGPPQGAAPAAPAGWGPPGAPSAGGQQGFGPAQGPPSAGALSSSPASSSPASSSPAAPNSAASSQPATQQSSPAGVVPAAASLPTAAPVAGGDPKAQVLGLLRAGEKAKAIELYRHHFKVSAMLAKEEVEYLAQTLKDE